MTETSEILDFWIPRRLARKSLGLGVAAISAGIFGLALARLWVAPNDPSPPELVILLNSAPGPVVEALPRVGPVMVSEILRVRRESMIRSIDDLRSRVARIGPVTVASLRPHVRFDVDPPAKSFPTSEP